MKLLKYSSLIVIISGIFSVYAIKAQTLSDNAEISLLTCNPGNELYSVFGHSAIRVNDPEKGIDWVYNYGTFNFNEPGFYLKFVRGQLNYQLSVYHMRDFLIEYRHENRSVYEQILDLNPQEKQKVFSFLEFNRLPENKYYLYDFFFDNCASRIRDVFQNELKGGIEFSNEKYNSLTFREMLKPYLEPQPWSRLGINLVLGSIADRPATLSESMFLPDYMKTAFDNAEIVNGVDQRKLIKSSRYLFVQKSLDNTISFFSRPGVVLSAFLLIIIIFSFIESKKKKYFRLIDFLVFLSIGTIGWILFLLWFATDHTAVVKNWNLLWALPTHFFIAFFVFRKSRSQFLKYYFLITGIFAFLPLPLWAFIPQSFDLAIIPMILILSIRSLQMYRYNNRKI